MLALTVMVAVIAVHKWKTKGWWMCAIQVYVHICIANIENISIIKFTVLLQLIQPSHVCHEHYLVRHCGP